MSNESKGWQGEPELIRQERVAALEISEFLANLFGKETFKGTSAEILTKMTKIIVETKSDSKISDKQRLKLYGILISEGLKLNKEDDLPFTVELGNPKYIDIADTLWIRNPAIRKKPTKNQDKDRKALIFVSEVSKMLKHSVFNSTPPSNKRRIGGLEDLDNFFEKI